MAFLVGTGDWGVGRGKRDRNAFATCRSFAAEARSYEGRAKGVICAECVHELFVGTGFSRDRVFSQRGKGLRG